MRRKKLKSPTLRATASLTKTGVKTAVSEAGTEFAQSLANMGIDLIDGTMDWEQVPDRLKQELTGWAAAAVIGGTAGVGVGIYNRSRGIRAIKEEIRGTVPDADLERTASAIFDSAAEKMADVVSVELELSSQLRNKHGSVMDSMQRAVKQAVDESGAFADIGEDVLAEYVVDTSKLFADQVLAEANIRNVPIEEVIKASDIVYENGGIRLKSQTGGGETRILADSSVNIEREQAEKTDVSQEKLYQLPQEAYDTQGKADINTPEFKAWFGDSKVVNKNGKPLVVYHGTRAEFDTFSKEKIKRGTGFWFSSNKETSKEYGDVKEFYLSVKNPIDVNKNRNDFIRFAKEAMPEIPDDVSQHYIISEALGSTAFKEYLQNKGYDAISLGNSYVVFAPNQIKSVYNQGTFDPNNDNIYYQKAYAGSRVDYEKPSLEAIGSGEGAQVHGWGLYYALDKDVAEGYRERFINEYGEGIVEYNGVVYKNNDDYAHFLLNL